MSLLNPNNTPPRRKTGWVLRLPWFGPAVVTLVMLTLMALLFWRMQTHHFAQHQQALDRTLVTAHESISTRLAADASFIGVLADQAIAGALISSKFHELTASYLSDHPHITAVHYTRPDHTILWASPTNEMDPGDDASLTPAVHNDAFQQSLEAQSSAYSQPYVDLTGQQCFDLYVPVFNRKKLLGTFVVTYSSRSLIHSLMDQAISQGYQTELLGDNDQPIYHMPPAANVDTRLIDTISLAPPDNGMSLRLSKYDSPYWDSGTVMLAAINFALISGMGMGIWALKRQIVERARAERALHDANADLENRVGERTHALSESNDMLAREMIERQVAEERARQHLDHLAQIGRVSTMGEMAAGLAHELHQPLTAITSYAKGCLRILNDSSPDFERVRYAVTHMDEQSTRAADIIDRLRTFLTPSSPQKLPHDLRSLIEESASFVELDRKRLDVDLAIDVGDQTPPVLVDRVQIQQVLVNLIKNAFESLQVSEKGQRSVTIQAVSNGSNEVEVHVRDSGPGCEAKDLIRVFEPFVSTKTGSMGMGLSISRTIIEAHEGRLWATAHDGRGMTFSFTIAADNHEKPNIT
jgi:signal transduction histidine kinase